MIMEMEPQHDGAYVQVNKKKMRIKSRYETAVNSLINNEISTFLIKFANFIKSLSDFPFLV